MSKRLTKGLGLLALAVFSVALSACGTDTPGTEPTATGLAPTATATSVSSPVADVASTATAASGTAPAIATPAPTSTPPPTPSPTSGPERLWEEFAGVSSIVSETMEWPRTVAGPEGAITLDGPPQRIHTLSLGHDEMIVALIGSGRFAGIGSATANPDYSNIADAVQGLPTVSRDAEQVIGLEPDLVIASEFTNQDLVDLIKAAGIPVFRSVLESSAEGNIPNILTLAYMLGAEDQALELIAEIESRLQFVRDRVPSDDSEKVRVVSMARFSSLRAAGLDSTEGGIIEAAGGINVADFSGHQVISAESIVAMNPDIILIPQSGGGDVVLRDELLADPVLQDVPAIRNGNVIPVNPTFFTTLSHWNVRGIEEAARMFYPDAFEGVEFEDFE